MLAQNSFCDPRVEDCDSQKHRAESDAGERKSLDHYSSLLRNCPAARSVSTNNRAIIKIMLDAEPNCYYYENNRRPMRYRINEASEFISIYAQIEQSNVYYYLVFFGFGAAPRQQPFLYQCGVVLHRGIGKFKLKLLPRRFWSAKFGRESFGYFQTGISVILRSHYMRV